MNFGAVLLTGDVRSATGNRVIADAGQMQNAKQSDLAYETTSSAFDRITRGNRCLHCDHQHGFCQ